jgi:hypothetical protein
MGVKLEGAPTAYAFQNYMLAHLKPSVSMQTGAGRSTRGIDRLRLDFREFLREIEIRGSGTRD